MSPISAIGEEPLEARLGPHLASCEWNMSAWLQGTRRTAGDMSRRGLCCPVLSTTDTLGWSWQGEMGENVETPVNFVHKEVKIVAVKPDRSDLQSAPSSRQRG